MKDHLIGILDKSQLEKDIENMKDAIVLLTKEMMEIKALLFDLKAFEEMNRELGE